MEYQKLNDIQWQIIEFFFPRPAKRGRGKPHCAWRDVINSILYVLTTPGAKWGNLPSQEGFASKSAAHRWYKEWKVSGLLDQILAKLKEHAIVTGEIHFPPVRQRRAKEQQEIVEEMAVNC